MELGEKAMSQEMTQLNGRVEEVVVGVLSGSGQLREERGSWVAYIRMWARLALVIEEGNSPKPGKLKEDRY
ncbi:hypothetical protein CRG98_022310 [Punica granatum]|uniref:Uncharacterized protein n=1 Tax=Punica granatum TaxID=22663 RepID=A0A2I0JM09_PUNGR|nr:hypothetical protein CRG98_022310 [Punica granatum]